MKQVRDAWYIRFPNGQEIKAKSTAAVIYHIQQGTIPKNSWARRSREEEWMKLEWHAEFTEAVTGIKPPRETAEDSGRDGEGRSAVRPPTGVAERMDPMQLRSVGVRGLLDDLLGAVDCAFRRDKLIISLIGAGLIGLVIGGVPYLAVKLGDMLGIAETVDSMSGLVDLAATIAAAIVFAITNALLTKMTYLELSTSRGVVGLSEAARGIVASVAKMLIVYIVLVGGAFYLMSVLHRLPGWLTVPPTQIMEASLGNRVLAAAISIVGLLCEVVLWVVIVLTWLLPPILVGEEYSLVGGIREWLGLIASHFNRIALAEVMTLGVGLLLAAPVFLPIQRALTHFSFYLPQPIETMAIALSATAFLTVVAVGNVFIFLDAKYEQPER